MSMTKLSIIIPAYNEADGVVQTSEKLLPVLNELRQSYEVEVLFIDDGSRDNTSSLLEDHFRADPDVRVIPHGVNKGLGVAIRTGFQNATGDLIVTTDFDGTYDFATIPELIQLLIDNDAHIVTASPYHPQGAVEGVPRYRLVFSYGASLMYRLLISWKIYCWTALFRAYRRKVIETISFNSNDFLAGTELLVKARKAGFRIIEYPTVLRQRTYGQSSMKVAKVTMSHLRFQWQLLLEKLGLKRPEAV
jgi:dolichol-phosphate mannosyltransferase